MSDDFHKFMQMGFSRPIGGIQGSLVLMQANDANDAPHASAHPITLGPLFGETAKLSEIEGYEQAALEIAGDGKEVVLSGTAPVWLYLRIAHALHDKAKRLIYRSAVTGDVVIFDHDPF
ncbi:MAG: CRISPR-associated protein Csx3 [Methylococcales bacterium]